MAKPRLVPRSLTVRSVPPLAVRLSIEMNVQTAEALHSLLGGIYAEPGDTEHISVDKGLKHDEIRSHTDAIWDALEANFNPEKTGH